MLILYCVTNSKSIFSTNELGQCQWRRKCLTTEKENALRSALIESGVNPNAVDQVCVLLTVLTDTLCVHVLCMSGCFWFRVWFDVGMTI